jgi:DNA end-binding protein Ku
MRPSWSGFLRLSLVSVPVQAYTAEEPDDGGLRFNQLHADCHRRIQYKKFCPVHGEVTKDEIVTGYEYAPDQYVVVDKNELEQSADDDAISIQTFVPPTAVDPSYYQGRTYFLSPDGDAGREPYALLREAMREEKRWALAQAFLWGRNRLVLIRPAGNLLVMEMMQFANQVRAPREIIDKLPKAKLRAAELKLARQLVAASSVDEVEWSAQTDERADELQKLVDAKVRGHEDLVEVKPSKRSPPTINLMEALKRSMQEPKKKKPKSRKGTASPRIHVAAHRPRRKSG